MTDEGTRIKVEIRRVVNLGDFNSLAYTFGVEENVPQGKKAPKHLLDVAGKLEDLLTSKLLENSQIEVGE